MRAWVSSVRALPMTFVIYLVEAAFAVVSALPLALEFTNSAPQGNDASAQAQWLEFLLALGPTARVVASSSLLSLSVLWLLSPWLQMSWLSALARREGVGLSLSQGARLWTRACLVTLWVSLGSVLALSPFVLGAWGLSRLSASRINDRVHDLGMACVLLPAIPLLVAAFAWLDLARARALHEGAWTSAVRSLRTAFRPMTMLRALVWMAAGWALFAVVQLVPFARWGGPALVVFSLQAAVLTRLFVRSRWLADALTCAEQGGESRADEAF